MQSHKGHPITAFSTYSTYQIRLCIYRCEGSLRSQKKKGGIMPSKTIENYYYSSSKSYYQPLLHK